MYNRVFQPLATVAEDSSWLSSTDVSDEHTGQRIGAQQAKAAFTGNTYVIEKARELLKQGATRNWRTVLQESLGEEISAKGMLEYFAPLMKYLQEQNLGREIGW